MDLQLAGRKAVVTGAASGIGAATALELATEGAQVVLVDVDKERLADVALHLPAGPHIEVTADLSTADGVASAMRQALSEAGQVDILVSNAGVCPWRSLAELSDED